MTVEIALWVLSASVIPALGWAIHITFKLYSVSSDVSKLVELQGNLREVISDTTKAIEGNTSAVKALTHYIQWLSKKEGIDPPPPIDTPVR